MASPNGDNGLSILDITPKTPSSNCSSVIFLIDHSLDFLNSLNVSVHFGSL